MSRRRTLAAVLGALVIVTGMSGCKDDPSPRNNTAGCHAEPPKWIYDAYVGVSRMTASGSMNDQKRIALERAIADLLMTKGVAQGESVMNVQKNLSVHNNNETFQKHFNVDSEMNIVYKKIQYDIKVTDIWRNPCTEELYVKIEEK